MEFIVCKQKATLASFINRIKAFIFTARSDKYFIELTLPQLLSLCEKANVESTVVIDTGSPSGILGRSLHQCKLDDIISILKILQKSHNFDYHKTEYSKDSVTKLNNLQFGYPYHETHCFRGYPLYGCLKQFIETDAKYILHLDCDMIFHEGPGFSWIQEGVRIMEENPDILCVLPRGGPPTKDGLLHQGTTDYNVDENRGLYLFKNFTSRHYLMHRDRFLRLLPMQTKWLSWREPIKSRLFGNGKMLCWETMLEHALTKSQMWRADLMTEQAWSLHPGDRSEKFYQLLPQIIDSVNRNDFPKEQMGHFDLRLSDWEKYISKKV